MKKSLRTRKDWRPRRLFAIRFLKRVENKRTQRDHEVLQRLRLVKNKETRERSNKTLDERNQALEKEKKTLEEEKKKE